jgi:site-specific DNA-cytosine methylase
VKQATALGAYIFQGGFTLGVRKHFKVLAHFEEGNFGTATVRKNLPGLEIFEDMPNWPVSDFAGRVDYLYANPPCAPWSAAGNQTNRIDWRVNPLTSCWRRTAELVWQLQPKVAHIESVRPLYTRGREMVEQIAAEGKKHGYKTIAILEDAYDCGIPQRRPRFVLCLTKYDYLATPTGKKEVTPWETLNEYYQKTVPQLNQRKAMQANGGSRQQETLKYTQPGEKLMKAYNQFLRDKLKGNGAPSVVPKRLHPFRESPTQTGQAVVFTMGNLRRASPELKRCIEYQILRETKPGGRLSRTFNNMFPKVKPVDGKLKGRPSMLKYRLHPDTPSPTQPGGAIIFHHKEDRYLTIGEAAALCGYPANFEFVGSISSAYAQMGKAVLPPVGAHLAHDALATIKAGRKLKSLDAEEVTIGRQEISRRPIDLKPSKSLPKMPKKSPNEGLPLSPSTRKDNNRRPSSSPSAGRAPRAGIGSYIRELLTGGVPEARIVDLVHRKFPASRATIADVKWNKGHMSNPGGKFYGIKHTARTK